MHGIFQDISVKDPSFQRFKGMEELFPIDSSVFMLGHPYYGSQGKVRQTFADKHIHTGILHKSFLVDRKLEKMFVIVCLTCNYHVIYTSFHDEIRHGFSIELCCKFPLRFKLLQGSSARYMKGLLSLELPDQGQP